MGRLLTGELWVPSTSVPDAASQAICSNKVDFPAASTCEDHLPTLVNSVAGETGVAGGAVWFVTQPSSVSSVADRVNEFPPYRGHGRASTPYSAR